jgi:hypothetical protein
MTKGPLLVFHRVPRRLVLLLSVGLVAVFAAALPSSASAASLPKLGALPTFNGVPQLVTLAQGKGIPVTASPACAALSPLGPIPVAVVKSALPIDVALTVGYTGNLKVSIGTPKDPAVCVLTFDLRRYGFSGALSGRELVTKLMTALKLPSVDPAEALEQIKERLEQAQAAAPALAAQIKAITDQLKSLKPAQLQDLLAQLRTLDATKIKDLVAQVQRLFGSRPSALFDGLLEQLKITLPRR